MAKSLHVGDSVVKCKDCKHQKERKGWGLICSRHNYSAVEPEGFCSWGERIETEEKK